jgi:hypothetical protein
MAIIPQVDIIKASNKGYSADLFVVTFNSMKETVDNGSKVHVLLVSFQLKFPCSSFFCPITCIIMPHLIVARLL